MNSVLKLGALVLLIAAFSVGLFFGFRAYSRHRDLSETLAWMDQTYNPHEGGANWGLGHGTETHYLEHRQEHTEEITEKFQTTFSYKGNCTIVVHDETFPVGVFKSVYTTGDYTLNLCDIDPASIRIRKFDPHNDVFDCSDPEQISLYTLNCDAGEVEFHTRNEAPAIKDDSVTTYAELTGKDHEAMHHGTTTKAWFIVDDVPYAERFAKALKHSVELCGGKPSKF